ncbi:MAG: hypothetical protein ABI637_02145 [Gemmatimonadota bacterium]
MRVASEAWSLSGRRISIEAEIGDGVACIASGTGAISLGVMRADANCAMEHRTARVMPDQCVVESGVARGVVVERWVAALDLPVAAWEIAAPPGCEIRAEIMARAAAESEQSVIAWAVSEDRESAALGAGEFSASIRATGGEIRAICGGKLRIDAVTGTSDPMRILFALSGNAADLARTIDLVQRRGLPGLLSQRAQHARLLADYGVAIETPEPGIAAAFEWAKVDADVATGIPAADVPGDGRAALDLLRRAAQSPMPSAAGDVLGAGLALWGVTPDAAGAGVTVRPWLPPEWPAMALRRLRTGPTSIDCEIRRRPGRIVARVARVSGPPLVVTVQPRGAAIASITVDDVALGGGRARFVAEQRHEVIFDLHE